MSRHKIAAVLSNYIPEATVDECTSWIIQKNIHLKITKGRASKFGDYKPLEKGKGHHISVNHDLNKYAFLITFVHEVAHLHTYTKYPFRHEPHGKEWKNEFRNLLGNFVVRRVFPEDISNALTSYLRNPAATSCSDHNLFRTLKKYDLKESGEEVFHLEELSTNSKFALYQSRSGMIFQKGEKMRTRYRCLELTTKRHYFVSGLAEVTRVENP
ncbi:MAG TPA: SprT-like domain-containing protein [Bacteroidia bacterium]|jgi:predicted SprT family Zn-dependent metalloprotease|nr:SprT-like domain-containing protein [Bacteroidota bacterium]MBP9790584.1 SprT-like domain-containing protein [Bacteroidia bacterium]MBK7430661.1 SprT-like domain-containing protein [Bacteroidota bacterium]MBK7570080.1 SprT-like domain-containing protein [Bacteroidota bacterium]MBK8585194.1 SprT-like domain-containing protein [Bacteroidota bacterium]